MKLGACYVVYEDSGFLAESVARIYPLVNRILFLVNTQPWEEAGDPSYPAATLATIARLPDPEHKLTTIHQYWPTEADQRNNGNDILRHIGCEWCLICDDDELYSRKDLANVITFLDKPEISVWGVHWQVYWKNRQTITEGVTGAMPTFIRTDPSKARFDRNRMTVALEGQNGAVEPKICICHHMSYVRTDAQMKRKTARLAQCERAAAGWYENVWLAWTSEMTNLHPVNPESFPRAIPASESPYQLEPLPYPERDYSLPIRLNIGSGIKREPGYRSCDIFQAPEIDEVFPMDAVPYPDGSVQAIYSEHALEHCNGHAHAEQVIAEWARVLEDGGRLILKVPDLEACCKAFVEASEDQQPGQPWSPREWYKYTIYGIQSSNDGEPAEAQYHRTGFTNWSLCKLLRKSGFDVESIAHYDGFGTPSLECKALRIPRGWSLDDLADFEDQSSPNVETSVDIIIPTYRNLPYLQVCIESIRAGTPYPHRILVVSSDPDPETSAWLAAQRDVLTATSEPRLHFAQAINAGIQASTALYVCLLNDDTIVGNGWLNALMAEVEYTEPGKTSIGAVNPFSNCDYGSLHHERTHIERPNPPGLRSMVPLKCELKIGMELADVEGIIPRIQAHKHRGPLVESEWIAFYATVIPRCIIDHVGLLDESFINGGEDVDYCRRIKAAGFRIATTGNAWVFHFGAKTRKRASEGTPEEIEAAHRENVARLEAKWRPEPETPAWEPEDEAHAFAEPRSANPLVAIYTGPGWEKWGPESHLKGGIGGSETAAIHVAEQFIRRGWEVILYGEHDAPHNGVDYRHHSRFSEDVAGTAYDLFVSSRTIEPFLKRPVRARHKLCWVHDTAISAQPKPLRPGIVDYLCLSDWHKEFFANFHTVAKRLIHVTFNGIDPALFTDTPPRVPGKLIYSSSPDRGLDVLLHMWPALQEVGATELHIFYGFQNWMKVVDGGAPGHREYIDALKQGVEQPGIHYHGRVGQAELAQAQLTASLWFYPTSFSETSCISAMEIMAAGVPVVCSDLAGLKTTVGDAGILLGGNPHHVAYQNYALKVIKRILGDPELAAHLGERGRAKAAKYTWSNVVDDWLALIGHKPAEAAGTLFEASANV